MRRFSLALILAILATTFAVPATIAAPQVATVSANCSTYHWSYYASFKVTAKPPAVTNVTSRLYEMYDNNNVKCGWGYVQYDYYLPQFACSAAYTREIDTNGIVRYQDSGTVHNPNGNCASTHVYWTTAAFPAPEGKLWEIEMSVVNSGPIWNFILA